MKTILFVLLLGYGVQPASAQAAYMDSIQSWRKDYIEKHELLKTAEEQSWLRFYPLSPAYRVVCSFEKLADSAWFSMPTSGARSKMARKYGRLTFILRDTALHLVIYQLQQLLASDETKNYLFVGFTDATSAIDTYGAGRYIDCVIGDIRNSRMVLDFNKAYNPYCAYTTGYNCPIPPRENDLPVAILAGEKNYGKDKH
jgi:uncharacterized protein (DUF1684 family)